MTKITFRWRPSLLLLAILVTGCVSFESVKQTATIGAQLSSQENVFDSAPEFCRIAKTKTDPSCAQLERDLENLHKVNRSLVAYAKVLNAMADDSKDKSYKDDVATMLGAASKVGPWSAYLNQNATSGISAGVDALIPAITSTYRRAELKRVVEENDDHIQNIKTGIDEVINFFVAADQLIQNENDKFEEAIKDNVQKAIKEGSKVEPPENVNAMIIAYRQLSLALSINRKELLNYKKTIDAFATAHRDLKENINKVGNRTGDLEVLQLISKDASTIAVNIDKASTPPNK